MTEACDLSAVDARALIGAGKLSPVDLLESCISRIEAVDPAINAVVARDFEVARVEAKRAETAVKRGDALGALHGLPLGVKDLIDAKGLPTSFGSPLYAANTARQDEAIVAMMRRAGAVVIGKTNVPEWGAGGNTRNALYGATGNPFDPAKSAAGSSGGSAAALATGMMPLATGSDTGGSVRNPAAYCGVVGFRPTPGLVASDSRNMAWLQISQLGPMARTVSDVCLMLSCMLEPCDNDPLSTIAHLAGAPDARAYANPPCAELAALRVAATTDFGFAPTAQQVAATFTDKLGLFASAFKSVTRTHPDCRHADEVFAILRAVAFLDRHKDLAEQHPTEIGANIHANVAEGLTYSAADVARALSQQTAMHRAWAAFFREFDILLAPTVTVAPRSWRELYPAAIDGRPTQSYYHWLALAYAATNVGHPVVALPVGRDAEGMPFGIQVIGRRGADLATLAVARELEAHLSCDPRTARPSPNIAWLKAQPPIAHQPGFKSFD
jgi:amidase